MTPPLLKRIRLVVVDEFLHRQIFPDHWSNGRLSSKIFKTQQPSVDRGSMTSGESAFDRQRLANLPTRGFCSVTVGECERTGKDKGPDCEVYVYEDPILYDEDTTEALPADDPRRNPAHAIIDFSHIGRGQLERVSKELHRLAEPRVRLLISD